MIIPALIGIVITPFYLGFLTTSYPLLVIGFTVQGFFVGSIYGQYPSLSDERFPTEVRATASGFCYHQGAIWGGLCGPLLGVWAATQPSGFVMPMLITTTVALLVFALALLLGPAQSRLPAAILYVPLCRQRQRNDLSRGGDFLGSERRQIA